MRFLTVHTFIAAVSLGVALWSPAQGWSWTPSAEFNFTGAASGGTLEIVHKRHEAHASIKVVTKPGDSHDLIRAAIREGLLAFPVEDFFASVATRLDPDYRQKWSRIPGLYLAGSRGEVVIGGTETGLGLLPPVGSVSAGYDAKQHRHTFRWHEKHRYTSVYACGLGGGGVPVSGTRDIKDPRPFHSVPAGRLGSNIYRYAYIVGFKDGLPTNASYIYTCETDQIEYFYHPFTNGIASNWTGWNSQDSPLVFREQIYPDMESVTETQAGMMGHTRELVSRCAQSILSESPNSHGGMYRFFIAQTPGRIFRPALRCHIMEEAQEFEGEWAFEIMTGVVDPERAYEMDNATRIVTADAWAELEANGEQISKWRFDQTMEHTDDWIMNQTGGQESEIPQKDIVLGESKTAVFFCVRLTGHKPNGIAMDGVRLVDVTDGFPNAELRKKEL
ncbi:MAG: hypothetical protein KF886_24005 [Candidatus Hydrogenedentes bacterium]|nr:hypothetical protein [Candidatus Hydrogenedentota bacterium]